MNTQTMTQAEFEAACERGYKALAAANASDVPMVRVRIALVVNEHGSWNAAGWSTADDDEMMGSAADFVEGREARYWLEVEVPLPAPLATLTPNVTPATP